MKTLDEVITALEICTADKCFCFSGCPYSYLAAGEDSCEYQAIPAMQIDALYYLKEFRDYQNANKTVIGNGSVSDAENNPPLTWDELREMEGKPVWVEWTKTEESYWCFVGEWFYDDEMRIYHIGRDYADYIHKTIYAPDIVQSFRKERK